MRSLEIDLETRSGTDLTRAGVYRYAEDPSFDIQLFGCSVDEGPVEVFDLACEEQIPEEILRALADEGVIKWAWNAAFERVCLSAWLRRNRPDLFRGYGPPEDSTGRFLSPASWRCSMVLAAYNGLPLSLKDAGAALKLSEQKLEEGRDLIRFFACPREPREPGGAPAWNPPQEAPDRWALYREYNRRDVEAELAIRRRLQRYPVPDSVWEEYHLDQQINDRGIRVDRELVAQAAGMDETARASLAGRMRELTGLENPASAAQLKEWLAGQGYAVDTLGKREVAAMLKTAPPALREVLELRLKLSKSSVSKYAAMRSAACWDGRCRGMFQFYGAARTGRWAGRLVQLQNLPQNKMEDLDEARALVKAGDYEALRARYPSVPGVLSELIRTAFIPAEGMKFIVADFSAIEARVLSYLAGESWRIGVFRDGRDIYCESASRMFHCVVEKNGRNAHLRQKGKIAELALGYGGSVGALKAMGALEMGLNESELQPLVDRWRMTNPHIVGYWWLVDRAVRDAVSMGTQECVRGAVIEARSGMLFITLPSGRRLSYALPRIGVNRFGGECVTYLGTDSQKQWVRLDSYGPKFVENIVQAVSRDLLAHAMRALRNLRIVGHVHDELIIECPRETDVGQICRRMAEAPDWLPGIELRADGYECPYYQKQ